MNVEPSKSGASAKSNAENVKKEMDRFFAQELAFLAEERQDRARYLGIESALKGERRN